MRKLSIFFYLLFLYCDLHAYHIGGQFLCHVNLVDKESETISLIIHNDEDEDNTFLFEYGYIDISKDGAVTLKKADINSFLIIGPESSPPIPAQEKKKITFQIIKPKEDIGTSYAPIGILISKVVKELPEQKSEKLTTAFKIVQNYLVQIYVQLTRPEIGQVEIDQGKINDNYLEFNISNHSKNLAESEIIIYLKKDGKSIGEPLTRKARLLANQVRTIKLELPNTDISSALFFFDDPKFELFQKEIFFK